MSRYYHIIKKQGQWQLYAGNAVSALMADPERTAVVKAARSLARHNGARIVVHKDPAADSLAQEAFVPIAPYAAGIASVSSEQLPLSQQSVRKGKQRPSGRQNDERDSKSPQQRGVSGHTVVDGADVPGYGSTRKYARSVGTQHALRGNGSFGSERSSG